MESVFLLSSIFHFSCEADLSEHDKGVQESTEGQESKNMYDESLDNEGCVMEVWAVTMKTRVMIMNVKTYQEKQKSHQHLKRSAVQHFWFKETKKAISWFLSWSLKL